MLQVNPGVLFLVFGVMLFASEGGAALLAILLTGAAERTAARGAAIGAVVGRAAWFAVAVAAAEIGFLDGGGVPPYVVLGVRFVLPLAIVALAFALFEPLRRLVSDPELQPSLIALQTFRVIGALWLVLLALHALPPLFAVPAGIGDVITGLTAIPAARSLRAGRVGRAVAWNLFGLLDFAVAVTTGAASGAAALGVLPLVLLPSLLVPFSIVLHVISLRSLAARRPAVPAYAS